RGIARVAIQHVPGDPLHVSAAPARPFAKLLARGSGRRRVECLPASLQQRLETPEVGFIYRPHVRRGCGVGRAEIGGRGALKPLNHGEGRQIGGGLEPEPCPAEDPRITRPIIKESLQGCSCVASAPAPAWPVNRAGKRSLLPNFEIYVDLV